MYGYGEYSRYSDFQDDSNPEPVPVSPAPGPPEAHSVPISGPPGSYPVPKPAPPPMSPPGDNGDAGDAVLSPGGLVLSSKQEFENFLNPPKVEAAHPRELRFC